MEVGVLYLPSVGSLEEKLKGFAGKRTDLYQELLHDLTVQSQHLDEPSGQLLVPGALATRLKPAVGGA